MVLHITFRESFQDFLLTKTGSNSKITTLKMSQIKPASDEILREENNIILIGNPGFSNINQSILSYLDHQSQMSFRSVCQSWKEQVDQPYFWIEKLDSKGQSKNLRNSWIDLVGRIQKGSDLEKEVMECFMKWYGLESVKSL